MKETKFKQTEVGMIPSDWDVKKVSDIASNFTGLTYTPFDVRDYGTLVLRSSNIQNGQLCFFDNVYVDMDIPERALVRDGDILVCVRNGSKALIGKSALISLKGNKTAFGAFMTILRAKENVCNIFLLYSWQSNLLQNQVQESLGATINQITNSDFQRYYIAVPPTIEEQQRIANALSDVDTLIANLEKLIAKKKNIKQGAMQQLLIGKKRLPGFGSDERTGSRPTDERRKECHSERSAKREVEESDGYKMTELGLIPSDWEVKKLSSVCTIIMGQSPDSKYYNEKEGTPLIQGNADIENRETFVRFYTTQITKKGLKGDLILTVRAPVGSVAKATFDCCLGRGVCALRNANDFLYQYLIYIEKEWAKRSAGSTFDSIKSDELSATLVVVPSSNAEQTAIANILSDMDTEISALETKLAKYRTLKTGMMQQLLTGKIRLV